MHQSGHLSLKEFLDEKLLILLRERILKVNWEHAKNDVKPFLYDPKQLDLWSEKFFRSN